MAKSFITRQIQQRIEKKAPAAPPRDEPRMPTRIWDDTDTCTMTGLRRRVLISERKARARGVTWDCVDGHAGMMEGWIRARAPHSDLELFTPVTEADGIITVEVVGKLANNNKVVGKKVCDGTGVIVNVTNGGLFCIGDQIDCVWLGEGLVYVPSHNTEPM